MNGADRKGRKRTRTANQQNEITGLSGAGAVTYDANGNLTADGSGNGYVYDAWDRLVAVNNGGVTVAAYGYNGLGERITETHGATTTDLYYSSSWQLLEEQVGGVARARDVWSPAAVDALVLRDQSSQGNGVLDQRLYVQQDANGNVTALVGVNGAVLERYAYEPYGAVTVLTAQGTTLPASAYGWLYLWQGKRYDGSVGLYDSRGRVYSPSLMRPLQADPLGLAPDVNDYRWEGNGPTGASDPSGLDIYVLFDETALLGASHAALVVGPLVRTHRTTGPYEGFYSTRPTDGGVYLYFSFGAGTNLLTSSDNVDFRFFSTLRAARQNPATSSYNLYLYYRENAETDLAVLSYLFTQWAAHPPVYNLFARNCLSAVEGAMNAAGERYYHRGWRPISSFAANQFSANRSGYWRPEGSIRNPYRFTTQMIPLPYMPMQPTGMPNYQELLGGPPAPIVLPPPYQTPIERP